MGDFKLTIDQQNRIVRGEWIGRFESKELGDSCEKCISEFKKYQKGELSALIILSEMGIRFMTIEAAKSVGEIIKFLISHSGKTAAVMPNFMFQKSSEEDMDTGVSNYRMFTTEQEAMRWLLG